MIDSARLERALIAVARRYAPALVPSGWMSAGDYPFGLPNLARRLADQGALVLAVEVRPNVPDAALYTKDWADTYVRLYVRLCSTLFPSFMQIGAAYVDQAEPPIAVLTGECAPVMGALGGYIAPYVAAHGGTRPSDMELRGVLDVMLDALEAGDLSREEYVRLRDEAAAIARRLLDLPVRQVRITPPARAIVGDVESDDAAPDADAAPPMPESIPEAPASAAPPPTLPEAASPEAASPEAAPPFPPDAVPLFFRPVKPDDDLPPPPVPPLPGALPS
ncbi:MAG: hypothetical protein JNL42_00175 [Anaerolineae bacterium]|nr:hypothetical protein [Anaerolineae bacterium]